MTTTIDITDRQHLLDIGQASCARHMLRQFGEMTDTIRRMPGFQIAMACIEQYEAAMRRQVLTTAVERAEADGHDPAANSVVLDIAEGRAQIVVSPGEPPEDAIWQIAALRVVRVETQAPQ